MAKIDFTDFEKEVIKKHIKQRLDFSTPIEEIKAMNAIIECAEALQDELGAIDEVMEEPDCEFLSPSIITYLNQQNKTQSKRIQNL